MRWQAGPTAAFMNTVPSVYTLVMNTTYIFLSTQVTERTVFRKHTAASVFFFTINIFRYSILSSVNLFVSSTTKK